MVQHNLIPTEQMSLFDSPPLYGTFDTETAGLFGAFRIGGSYDGREYRESLTVDDMMNHIFVDSLAYVWYAHNLEFDLGVIMEVVPITLDWTKCIFINRKPVKIVCMYKGMVKEFHDSYALMPDTLANILDDFDCDTRKIDLSTIIAEQYESIEDYYSHVPIDDALYREYLKHDVLGLYEALGKLNNLVDLPPSVFHKKCTAASLSMKFYQTHYPEAYMETQSLSTSKETDTWLRGAMFGGRVEVFRKWIGSANNRNTIAYHYDVNSLYPFVMSHFLMPYGRPYFDERCILPDKKRNQLYIAEIDIYIPDNVEIPTLPLRRNERLIYPVGEMHGIWTSVDIEYAVSLGAEIRHIYKLLIIPSRSDYLQEWAKELIYIKEHSKGAKKATAKILLNSLPGKFGECSEKTKYIPHSDSPSFIFGGIGIGEITIEVYMKSMKPIINAFVTAYARTILHDAGLHVLRNHGEIIYCDTDSWVSTIPFPKSWTHTKITGKWKLENELTYGVFVAPKMYAEAGIDHTEIIKGKGLARAWRETASIHHYREIAEEMTHQDVKLYADIPTRIHVLKAIQTGQSFAAAIPTKKTLRHMTQPKRIYDADGTSRPINISEELREAESLLFLNNLQREADKNWHTLRNLILNEHGIKPTRDYPRENIPRSVLRLKGKPMDEMAAICGFERTEELAEVLFSYAHH